MRMFSTAISAGGRVPQQHTCDGAGVSPPLQWADVPDGVQSFALLCDDPDAPSGVFTHWVLFNLSSGSRELPEGVPADAVLSIGARQGTNSFGEVGYGAACPPPGDREHRYIFTLYALDSDLTLAPGARKDQLLDAMRDHVLAEAQLVGKYSR